MHWQHPEDQCDSLSEASFADWQTGVHRNEVIIEHGSTRHWLVHLVSGEVCIAQMCFNCTRMTLLAVYVRLSVVILPISLVHALRQPDGQQALHKNVKRHTQS